MKTDSKTSPSKKISQNLLNAAQPLSEITAATNQSDLKSKVRISSLDSMTITNSMGEARGLKLQNKTTSTPPVVNPGSGAKIVAITSATKKTTPNEDTGN